MRRWWRWIGLALVVCLVAGLAAGYWYARPLLLTGTGYAAHNACALAHLADRTDAAADLPPNPLVPVLRTSVDERGARAGVFGVLARQRATYTRGYGCTVGDAPTGLPRPTDVDVARDPLATAPRPRPSAPVREALDRAFGADLGPAARSALGTRAVLVLHDGRLVGERYARGFGPGTRQLGWSLTKSATNLLLGRLVRQGRVDVGRDRLVPSWRDGRRAVTVEQLEQMTSGLAWDETYALGSAITRMLYLEPDMAGFVASQPLAHEPGRRLQYSSGSTTLLCRVLADASGRRGAAAADLMRAELFAPLGTDSFVVEPDGTGTPVCSSYGWATPRDWAVLGQLALDDGRWQGRRLLPPGWIAESTRAVDAAVVEDPGYASGWWANRRADGSLFSRAMPADTFFGQGHDGQWLVVVPSADLVVLRLGFSPEGDDERVPALVGDLVEALD